MKAFDLVRRTKAAFAAVLATIASKSSREEKALLSDILTMATGLNTGEDGLRRSFTKKGPGRVHNGKRPSRPKYPHARVGGNWQGKEYITCAEYDAICRSYLRSPSIPRDDPFHAMVVLGAERGQRYVDQLNG